LSCAKIHPKKQNPGAFTPSPHSALLVLTCSARHMSKWLNSESGVQITRKAVIIRKQTSRAATKLAMPKKRQRMPRNPYKRAGGPLCTLQLRKEDGSMFEEQIPWHRHSALQHHRPSTRDPSFWICDWEGCKYGMNFTYKKRGFQVGDMNRKVRICELLGTQRKT